MVIRDDFTKIQDLFSLDFFILHRVNCVHVHIYMRHLFLAFVVCLRRQSKRFQRSWRLKRCGTSRLVTLATFERRSIGKAIFPLHESMFSTRFFFFSDFVTYLFIILVTRSSNIRYDISQRGHFVFSRDQVSRRNNPTLMSKLETNRGQSVTSFCVAARKKKKECNFLVFDMRHNQQIKLLFLFLHTQRRDQIWLDIISLIKSVSKIFFKNNETFSGW